MNLARKNILNVKPYVAGKPVEETKRQLGLTEVIKLASNENPLGPSPKAVSAVKKAAAGIHRYPDSSGFYLKRTLARHLRVGPENIVIGNGSDELIDIAVRTFVEDDEKIATSETTFLEYEIAASVHGRAVVTVPLCNFKYDLAALRKKITPSVKMVFIANPNNPTGTYVSRGDLDGFLRGLPARVIVVLDEAYETFIDVDDFPRSLDYINKSNVIVLNTFSKAYGLAGLRIGYAVARAEIAAYMERARQPFNVNLLAQAGAEAALDDRRFLRKTRSTVLSGKQFLYQALREMGLAYVPSVANFILIDVGCNGAAVFKEMLACGVIVRDMEQYGLNNFIRVTIGTPKENERFVQVLREVLCSPSLSLPTRGREKRNKYTKRG